MSQSWSALQVQEAIQSPSFMETLQHAVKLSAERGARDLTEVFKAMTSEDCDLDSATLSLAKIAPFVHNIGTNMLQPCSPLQVSLGDMSQLDDLCAVIYARGPRSSAHQ